MLRLLLGYGFVARKVMLDYFGADKHRFYCQLKEIDEFIHPDDRYLAPTGIQATAFELLQDDRYVLTDVVESVRGPCWAPGR